MTNDVSYRKVLCLLAGAVVLLMVVLAPKPRAAYAEAAPAEQNEAIDPTQWVAVDDLGRTVATYEDTGAPRQDRYVGIFYWTWHIILPVIKPSMLTMSLKSIRRRCMITMRKSGRRKAASAGGTNRFTGIIPARINMF